LIRAARCVGHPADAVGYRFGRDFEGVGRVQTSTGTDELQVWIEQDLCTGDGLCVQYAPEVFEFDVDGLAYVKDDAGELRQQPGDRVGVPAHLRLEVIDAAKECPGDCIHVTRSADDVEIAGPDAG
jgi:ferredoxin